MFCLHSSNTVTRFYTFSLFSLKDDLVNVMLGGLWEITDVNLHIDVQVHVVCINLVCVYICVCVCV